jgi:xylulokinase
VQTPKPLWSEQDPQQWWTGTAKSIREVLAAAARLAPTWPAVGLTGQMHGLVLLDKVARCCGPRSCGTTSAPAPSATRSASGWAAEPTW